MTKDITNLLTPRYKLISDYPGNLDPIGETIFPFSDHNQESWCVTFDQYPHLFKKLHWWQERTEEEMPMYLKHTLKESETTYHKIEKWDMQHLRAKIEVDDHVCDIQLWTPNYTYQPATEEEYLNSLK